MNFTKYLVASAILASSVSAMAAPTTIDFEGTGSFSSISDFYNGGIDGVGNSGTNYGVAFSASAQSLANDELGTYFSNAPTPGSVMFVSDGTAFLNAAQGFYGAVSLYYSSTVEALNAINIYSGLNGTGSVLGSFNLGANAQNGCSDTAYCHFDNVSVAFAGTGQSIGFSNTQAAYDNVSITPVPEPTGYALMALGLVAVGFVARRRAAA
jgi:hypothetical protein